MTDKERYIKSIKDQIEQMEKQVSNVCREIIEEKADGLFSKYPQLQTIGWNQFIPYFNDGEPCEFTIYSVSFSPIKYNLSHSDDSLDEQGFSKVNYSENIISDAYGMEDYDDEINSPFKYEYGDDDRVNEEMKADMIEFNKFISKENLSYMEKIFGSHAVVLINRDGIQFAEYEDHD